MYDNDGSKRVMNKTNHLHASGDEYIYYLGFAIYMMSMWLEMSVISNIAFVALALKLARYLSYVLFIYLIVVRLEISRRIMVLLVAIASVVVISTLVSHDKTNVFLMLFFCASMGINANKILDLFCKLLLSFWVIVVLLSRVGIIKDYIWDIGTRNRHMLGFKWTTTAPILFLFITFTYIALKKGRLRIIESMIFVIVSYWLFVMTNTRLAFALNVFVVVFFCLFGKSINEQKRLPKAFSNLLSLSPFVLCMLVLLLYMLYDPNNVIMLKMNGLLSNRLALGANAIEKYGLHLFGCQVKWVGWSINTNNSEMYNYVDCSYLQIGIQQGLLVLFVVLLIQSIIIYCSVKNQQFYMCWIVLFILLFGVNEPQLMNIGINIFPVLVATNWCVSTGSFNSDYSIDSCIRSEVI